jgi:hypothetical protein
MSSHFKQSLGMRLTSAQVYSTVDTISKTEECLSVAYDFLHFAEPDENFLKNTVTSDEA